MENLQKEINDLTREFHELAKCSLQTSNQKLSNQRKGALHSLEKNNKQRRTHPKRPAVPLVISNTIKSDDWRDIEILNLLGLLSNGKPKTFFRLDVDYHDVKVSLKNNGILSIKPHIHRNILLNHAANDKIEKYLLLQEESLKPLDYTGTMIGVAHIAEETVNNNITIGDTREDIRVMFLSLSRSNLDLSSITMCEVEKIENLLWQYIDLLKKKMVLPFISEIYPWCKNFSVPSTSPLMIDEKVTSPETVNTSAASVPNIIHATLPQSNHFYLKNGSNIEPWFTTEYNNLEGISDWAGSKYFFADINIGELYESLIQGTSVEVDELLYNDIDCLESRISVYLVIRKRSFDSIDDTLKPVVGIAQVLGKDDEYRLKCIFISLSRPQYVGSPWNDAKMFVDGQEIVHKEDVRIILDEYKLSLRHRKAEPLFDDLFPWCPTADPDPSSRKELTSVPAEKKSVKLQFSDKAKIKVEEKPPLDQDGKNECGRKLFSPTDRQKRGERKGTFPRSGEKPPQKSATSPRRMKNPASWKNDVGNRNLPSAMMSSKSLPPLSNLLSYDKALSTLEWHEIECQNIGHILEAKQIDVYLCDTSIKQIHRSFRDGKLEISQKNMENIASSTRAKKFLILRVASPQGVKHVVGVACVRPVSVSVSNTASDRFLISVTYSSLSCPLLSNLSAKNHYDGMEVYPNIVNSFLQQYKFLLSKNKVKPLFMNVYPWNGVPPEEYFNPKRKGRSSLRNSKPKSSEENELPHCFDDIDADPKGVSSPPKPTLVDLDDFSSFQDQGMWNCFLDESSCSAVSYADIRKDLDVQSIRASPIFESYIQEKIATTRYPTSSIVRREEAQRNWSRDLFHQINSPVRQKHSGYRNGDNSKVNVVIEPPSIGRGRGRGRLLHKLAKETRF